MNRRCITMLLGIGLCLATQAYGQSAISPTVKSAGSISQNDQNSIRQFVQAQVAKIAAEDATQQTEGRDALVNALAGDPPASAAFNDAYSLAVNDALLPLADNPSLRVRINAAIVAAKVAAKTNTVRLKPAAMKFIADKADPVVLWGVKAHSTLIPTQLRIQAKADDPMLKGFVPALKDNLVGPIMQEAYEALRLNLVQDRQNVRPEMIKAVVPVIQELLAARIALYQNGVPDNPMADTLATTFLVDADVWVPQSQEERTRTAQLIVNLIGAVAARTADFENDRAGKDPLIQTLRLISSAVRVTASHGNKTALESAALPVSKVDVSMPSATIIKTCDDLIVQMITDIPGLKRPEVAMKPMAATAAAQ